MVETLKIYTTNVSREEVEELREYLDNNDWEYSVDTERENTFNPIESIIIVSISSFGNYYVNEEDRETLIDYLENNSWKYKK